jgi:hypothetical protein
MPIIKRHLSIVIVREITVKSFLSKTEPTGGPPPLSPPPGRRIVSLFGPNEQW